MRRLFLCLILFPASAFAVEANGYAYKYTYVVPAKSETMTDFVVTLTLSSNDLKTAANGGQIRNTTACGVNSIACPADWIFTTDSAGVSPTSWDWEAYDGTAGTGTVHVKYTLSSSGATTIYGWYGKASISTLQCTASATWATNYLRVFHYAEASYGSWTPIKDSSSYASNAYSRTDTANWVTGSGKLGPAMVALWVNGYASLDNIDLTTGAWTLSAWWKAPDSITDLSLFSGTQGHGNLMRFYSGAIHTGGSDNVDLDVSYGTLTPGTWYKFDIVSTAAHAVTIYKNGSSIGSGWLSAGNTLGGLTSPFDGSVDELRVITTARSAAWIAAEYANQNEFGAFGTTAYRTEAGGAEPPTGVKRRILN